MKSGGLQELRELIDLDRMVIRVSIIKSEGSTPQEVGSYMTVGENSFFGTIGGGTLEFEALRKARELLRGNARKRQIPWHRIIRDFSLGPSLGQCCGGSVQLLFESLGSSEIKQLTSLEQNGGVVIRPLRSGVPWEIIDDRKTERSNWPLPVKGCVREFLSGARQRKAVVFGDWYIEPLESETQPFFLYGAGHVGRAVIKAFEGLPFKIYWVDTDSSRFPDFIPTGIEKIVSQDPAEVSQYAPPGTWHVVMTYSHAIDFHVCSAVLKKETFGYLGVIASKTKRARFVKRLRAGGVSDAAIAQLHAPIGLEGLEGKEPSIIAVSLAADFLYRLQKIESRAETPNRDKVIEV